MEIDDTEFFHLCRAPRGPETLRRVTLPSREALGVLRGQEKSPIQLRTKILSL